MSRLADYFVVVGYDHEKSAVGEGCGHILQRFPETDWDNCPFTQGIEQFCQPSGWQLSSQKLQTTFFVSVLTDIEADRHYCACLTFSEDVTVIPSQVDEDEEHSQDGAEKSGPGPPTQANGSSITLVQSARMFAPKSLVLVSRLNYFETFRNCLGLIYTVYLENMQVELETLIGNILGCIQVPPPGGPQVRFSIGAGDRQALQPPLCSTLPVTHTDVALFFQHLGISNALMVFCAAMTDHKILFHSQSYSRLTSASHAVTSLMYPLKYSYVYIPLLPVGLIEVLNTPTPFIAGVHSSLKPEISELLDVVVVDLDGGSIHMPERVILPMMPEPLLSRMRQCLNMMLLPDLLAADYAFPSSPSKQQPPEMVDKEIRAIFLRMFAELFFGYRSCLTIIRIHPEPVITFHKANFLGHRGLVEDEFTTRVLDSMSFNAFVAERGPPYRVCDIFDEVFASMQDMLKTEEENPDRLLHNIRDLAQQLHLNENPNPQPYAQKVPKPPDGAHTRVHQPVFPTLDRHKIMEIIEEGIAKHSLKSKLGNPKWSTIPTIYNYLPRLSQIRPQQPRIVPIGSHVSSAQDRAHVVSMHARRLEVLRNCVNFIFDNKISDARKIFPAVLRALKTKVARLALVHELSYNVQSNRSMLEHQQFDLVVRLLNCALQNDSSMDEYGVAAAILPLSTAFCRKLCTGVIQFAYTCIQEHAVWANNQFWEASFYQDVQHQIRLLYLPKYQEHLLPDGQQGSRQWSEASDSPASPRENKELRRTGSTPDASRRNVFRPRDISALEIAAEQLRTWNSLKKDQQTEMIANEESTVYSQAIHYSNRMVYMRVPLDASKSLKDGAITGLEGESTSSNVTNSLAESDSFDAESGFDEQEVSEVGANVVKFVNRFVDKVCTESGVSSEHLKSLHQMIPGVVAMHIETLEAVHRESKRLPPIQKPKILTPTLLPGEEIVMEGLRVFITFDGREEGTGTNMGGPALLPAEGAIFLTTYRVIFKGTPCDPLVCEQIVCRSFPVSSLVREKKINVQYLAHLDHWLQEGLQLRSNTFQLLKIAFDEEVSSDDIETFRKLLHKVRNPPTVLNTFAFTGHVFSEPSQLGSKVKEKNASLKGFAKRTLMKTAKKAGFKTKESGGGSTKRQKYMMPTPPMARRVLSASLDSGSRPASGTWGEDELSVIDEQEIVTAIQTDSKNVDRLAERCYSRDYARLGLGSVNASVQQQRSARAEPFRISMVNMSYTVCRSYPSVLVVPQSVRDESLRRFARSHRQYRFPVVTWRHPVTKAVLLRASGFHGKSVMGMLKHNTSSGGSSDAPSASFEQEKYISALVAATPTGNRACTSTLQNNSHCSAGPAQGGTLVPPPAAPHTPSSASIATSASASSISDSLTSLDSLLWAAAGGPSAPLTYDPLYGEMTPDPTRRNPLTRAISGLRSSGGKAKLTSAEACLLADTPHMVRSLSQPFRRLSSGSFDLDLDIRMASFESAAAGKASHRNPLRRAIGSLRQSFGKSSVASPKISSLGRAASLRDHKRPLSAISLQYNSAPKQNGSVDIGDLDSTPSSLHRAALYVLGEKTQMKGIKLDSFPKCDFIPVDYYEVRHVKSSFKKLLRACVPSAPVSSGGESERGFLKAVEDSEWLNQMQNVLQIAGATVDLLDVQGSSVMLCLEDGWDFTTQVVSVAQLCLDPYYRTVEGFRVLVEKEWLSFGHRFTHRSNQTAANQASGFAPIFLQFLDTVHQIHNQFPLSFEFNQYLLKFLAYHCVSNRFRTFMLDCEFERMEAGWLLEDSRKSKLDQNSLPNNHSSSDSPHISDREDFCPNHTGSTSGISIWDYIEKYHKKSPVFQNFLYSPADQETVLRPYSNISNLRIWDYYLKEDLAHGPSYDFEIIEKETHMEEEEKMIDGPFLPNPRRIINGCYDNIEQLQPDMFVHLLQELQRLELDRGEGVRWQVAWEQLEVPRRDLFLQRQVSFSTQIVRFHGRSIHKRSTVELLVKGKMLGEAAKMFSQPHRFEKFTYTTPAYCDYCHHVLWGLVKTGMRCSDCGYNCHEKCMSHVPKNCTKLRPVSEVSNSSTNLSINMSETTSVSGGRPSLIAPEKAAPELFTSFSGVVTEHRTHEGYLFKRGALLKGWKQRWFVLDSMKHQLRYYDSREDANCKGFIDLAEVVSVGAIGNVQGAPKRSDENAFFEMKTVKRIYNFLAPDSTAAQEWIDKVQSCIQ